MKINKLVDANGDTIKCGYFVRIRAYKAIYKIVGASCNKLKLLRTDWKHHVEWEYAENVIRLDIEELL